MKTAPADLAPLIDHALLDPHHGIEALHRCCDEARHFGFAAVCVASRWVAQARERLPVGGPVRLVSVVGFPFGAVPAAVKRAEAEAAAAAGADELDVVPDFGALADRQSGPILDDLAALTDLMWSACAAWRGAGRRSRRPGESATWSRPWRWWRLAPHAWAPAAGWP